MENSEQLLPELIDIRNRIMAYNTVHPDGCFIFRFVGWKDSAEVCPECDEYLSCFDENKSAIGLCGDIETVREMLNELRNVAEDFKDEDGVVII